MRSYSLKYYYNISIICILFFRCLNNYEIVCIKIVLLNKKSMDYLLYLNCKMFDNYMKVIEDTILIYLFLDSVLFGKRPTNLCLIKTIRF